MSGGSRTAGQFPLKTITACWRQCVLLEDERWLLQIPRWVPSAGWAQAGDRQGLGLLQVCSRRGWKVEDNSPNSVGSCSQLLSLLLRNHGITRFSLQASENSLWQCNIGFGEPRRRGISWFCNHNAIVERQSHSMDEWSCWKWRSARPRMRK